MARVEAATHAQPECRLRVDPRDAAVAGTHNKHRRTNRGRPTRRRLGFGFRFRLNTKLGLDSSARGLSHVQAQTAHRVALQGEEDENGVEQGQQRDGSDAGRKLVVIPLAALQLHLPMQTIVISWHAKEAEPNRPASGR